MMHCHSGWDEEGTWVCCWGVVDGEFKVIFHQERFVVELER